MTDRLTDFRVDTVEMSLAKYQRLSHSHQLIFETYGTWLQTPQQAALGNGIVRFELPVYRWTELEQDDDAKKRA
jgi:hypothetical protein